MALRIARAASLALLLIIFGYSIVLYPDLPARIPTHFDLDGTPNVWSETSVWTWFLLPTIAAFVYAVIAGISWYMRIHPHLVNVPDRKKFDELPPHLRDAILRYTDLFLHGTCASVMLLFLALIWGINAVASGAPRVPPAALAVEYAVLLSAFVSGPFFAWFIHDRAGRFYRSSGKPGRMKA